MIAEVEWEELRRLAFEGRGRAYAPYSGFAVGAALRARDGSTVLGCNVENASYGVAICAERTALAGAVVAGHREFEALAIASAAKTPSPPCGICRQALVEFAPDLAIRSYNEAGQVAVYQLSDLLPHAFRADQLD